MQVTKRQRQKKEINRECFKDCKEQNKGEAQNKSKSQTSPIIPHFLTVFPEKVSITLGILSSMIHLYIHLVVQSTFRFTLFYSVTQNTSPTTFSIDNTKQPTPLEREIFWQHLFLTMR